MGIVCIFYVVLQLLSYDFFFCATVMVRREQCVPQNQVRILSFHQCYELVYFPHTKNNLYILHSTKE